MATSSDFKDFLIDKSTIQFGEIIGHGGFSQIWAVQVKDTTTGQTKPAAAKKVRGLMVQEIQVMKSLKHQNVVMFYGVVQDGQDAFIIMELAEQGDLRRYLNRWREKESNRLPLNLIWKWVFEAASGISYLHRMKHSHRDIKSLNYLIMQELTLKLGDLGLAKEMDQTQETSGVRGTCRWMAPEVIKEQKRSIKSDIYSFGMVIWEMFTTGIPFGELKGDFQVMNAVCKGERPAIPEDCPAELRELIVACWQDDYRARPEMAEICEMVQKNVQAQETYRDLTKQMEGPGVAAGVEETPMEEEGLDTDNHKGQEEAASFQEVHKLPLGDVDMVSVSPHTSKQSGQLSPATMSEETNTDTVAMYKMCHVPRGVCLIINNQNFSAARDRGLVKLYDRQGSHVDVGKLDNIFRRFLFDIKTVTDKTTAEMCNELDDIRRMDHTNHDALVCCILTHGKLGEVAGVAGQYLRIQEILSYFTAEKCPSLTGKPKIFFIQACQGHESQEKLPIKAGAIQQDAPPPIPGIAADLAKTIPNQADFLLGFATVPGHVSYRNTVLGSWYISILTDKLERLHEQEDLLSILTEVNRKLSRESAKVEKEGVKGTFGQVSAPVHSLRKKLYFTVWESAESAKK